MKNLLGGEKAVIKLGIEKEQILTARHDLQKKIDIIPEVRKTIDKIFDDRLQDINRILDKSDYMPVHDDLGSRFIYTDLGSLEKRPAQFYGDTFSAVGYRIEREFNGSIDKNYSEYIQKYILHGNCAGQWEIYSMGRDASGQITMESNREDFQKILKKLKSMGGEVGK